MPFKFWKKEKAEKGKEEPEGKEEPGPEKEAQAPAAEVVTVAPEATAAPKPVPPGALEAAALDAHGQLVELGLTIPATKEIFAKRFAPRPGAEPGFLSAYEAEPYKAVTRVLAAWLGIHAAHDFDPARLLEEANPRLSSFGIQIELREMSWLDQELGLRKAKLVLGGQEKVVRFKDARDLMKGVNELIAPKRVAFLELETWSDDFDFLLVREPRWDRLAATNLVVIKAPQTAADGECGECGAKVGKNWNDCLSCGAVFG